MKIIFIGKNVNIGNENLPVRYLVEDMDGTLATIWLRPAVHPAYQKPFHALLKDNSLLMIKEPLIIELFKRSKNIIITNQEDIDFIHPHLCVTSPRLKLKDDHLEKDEIRIDNLKTNEYLMQYMIIGSIESSDEDQCDYVKIHIFVDLLTQMSE